jgi:hypothetical protein
MPGQEGVNQIIGLYRTRVVPLYEQLGLQGPAQPSTTNITRMMAGEGALRSRRG